MEESILFWATVASPIIGMIAIIVALVTAKSSSRDAEKQIKAVYNLLDVFVAAQKPNMIVAKQQYEQQLTQLDEQIEKTKRKIETVSPFIGRGAKIEVAECLQEKEKQIQHLEDLQKQHDKVESQLKLILSYFNKTTK